MENREAVWEKHYRKNNFSEKPDKWIENYLTLFRKNDRIIEAGCGTGYLSEYLLNKGYQVLSTDISEAALKQFTLRFPDANVMKLDINEALPFKSFSFEIIIADLCIHYFSKKETETILEEFRRILTPGGKLIARVNSDKDIHHGAGEGIEVEEGFFCKNSHYKRFFNSDMLKRFFKDWEIISMTENTSDHYKKIKHIIEIAVSNIKDY